MAIIADLTTLKAVGLAMSDHRATPSFEKKKSWDFRWVGGLTAFLDGLESGGYASQASEKIQLNCIFLMIFTIGIHSLSCSCDLEISG